MIKGCQAHPLSRDKTQDLRAQAWRQAHRSYNLCSLPAVKHSTTVSLILESWDNESRHLDSA